MTVRCIKKKEAPDPQNFELKKMNFSHKVRKIFFFKLVPLNTTALLDGKI